MVDFFKPVNYVIVDLVIFDTPYSKGFRTSFNELRQSIYIKNDKKNTNRVQQVDIIKKENQEYL